MPWVAVHTEFVVTAAEILDERMPAVITRAERSCLRPRIAGEINSWRHAKHPTRDPRSVQPTKCLKSY